MSQLLFKGALLRLAWHICELTCGEYTTYGVVVTLPGSAASYLDCCITCWSPPLLIGRFYQAAQYVSFWFNKAVQVMLRA
jgi:hypothetical protein